MRLAYNLSTYVLAAVWTFVARATTGRQEGFVIMAIPDELDRVLQTHRIGHLATAEATGAPHLIPICFVYHAQCIYSAIDHKPKRATGYRMKRVRNIVENPQVAFLVDHYEEDWSQLSYILIRGRAMLLEDGPEFRQALGLLEAKYEQYQEHRLVEQAGLVIKIVPQKVQRWGWHEASS
jgi:coenzyme F420-0:L-glutamate ligase/coenzyme F420-1:gamma-L-glutamate ligase